uniref:Glycine N-acyltransferase-like protein n=1 Tax=Capra hircus TaxID=9925 RepID=A0A8C2Y0C3_CAPHI
MEGAQQALPVETLPLGSHSSEFLRTRRTGRTCGIRKQLRPLEKSEPQRGTLPNTGPGRRDSPHAAAEGQLGVRVQLSVSAQQAGDQTNRHTSQDHSTQKVRVISGMVFCLLFWGEISAETEGEDSVTGSQSSLNEVIQSLAATKFVKVEHTQCILYVTPETARKLLPSLLETKNLHVGYGTPKAINEEMFKLSSMDPTHAALVNKFWHFGGNERSQRFIERCIRTFPTFCLLGPEGTPASWSLMDQTGEIRMGATLPEYRGHGLISHMLAVHTRALDQLGIPAYNHTDKANKIIQRISHNLHHIAIPCGWNQWNCEPL